MKQSLVIFALLLSASFAHGQSVGLGIGSSGLVIKSNPSNNWRFGGRVDVQLTDGFSVFQPSLMVARQVVNEEKAKFYVGGELGLRLVSEFESNPVLFRIPLGVEYFPFEGVPISATVEGSPYFFFEEESTIFFFSSLIEIAYYFGR